MPVRRGTGHGRKTPTAPSLWAVRVPDPYGLARAGACRSRLLGMSGAATRERIASAHGNRAWVRCAAQKPRARTRRRPAFRRAPRGAVAGRPWGGLERAGQGVPARPADGDRTSGASARRAGRPGG